MRHPHDDCTAEFPADSDLASAKAESEIISASGLAGGPYYQDPEHTVLLKTLFLVHPIAYCPWCGKKLVT